MRTIDTKEEKSVYSANPVTKLIWWVGGAVPNILVQFPSEYGKYYGIGGAIIGTWVLATVSSYHAIFLVFNDRLVSTISCIIWGLIILNYDRLITLSMRKRGSEVDPAFFYERFILWFKEILPAIPRVVVAIIIGILIAVPLELQIFDSEIATELERIKDIEMETVLKKASERSDKIIASYREEINNAHIQLNSYQKSYLTKLKDLDQRIDFLKNQRNLYDSHRKELEKRLWNEIRGTPGKSTGKRGYGPVAKRLKELLDKEAKQVSALIKEIQLQLDELYKKISEVNKEYENDNNIINLKNRILKLEKYIDTEIDKIRKRKNELGAIWEPGLLIRIKALFDLGKKDDTIWWSLRLFIIMIFLIEAGPIIAKMISPRGAYDAKIDQDNYINMINSDWKVEKLRRGIRKETRA